MQFSQQIIHQDRDLPRVLCQPGKTRPEQQAIATLQLRQAGITQPVGHAAQRVEQITQLPGHAVAAGAQTQVADRPLHSLRLQQRLAGTRQNELLLFRIGSAQQVDDAACLQRRQRLATYRGQHRGLVAHGQPCQLPRQTGRQQAQTQLGLGLVGQSF